MARGACNQGKHNLKGSVLRARADFCDLGSLEGAIREERLSTDLVRLEHLG